MIYNCNRKLLSPIYLFLFPLKTDIKLFHWELWGKIIISSQVFGLFNVSSTFVSAVMCTITHSLLPDRILLCWISISAWLEHKRTKYRVKHFVCVVLSAFLDLEKSSRGVACQMSTSKIFDLHKIWYWLLCPVLVSINMFWMNIVTCFWSFFK